MYSAFMDQIRVKLLLNVTVDVVKSLEDMLDIFMEQWDRCRIIYELVCYSMFVLQDLRKTCEYVTRLMELGEWSTSFLVSKLFCSFFCFMMYRTRLLRLIILLSLQFRLGVISNLRIICPRY